MTREQDKALRLALLEQAVRHANNILVEALANGGSVLSDTDEGARDALRAAVRSVDGALFCIRGAQKKQGQ